LFGITVMFFVPEI